MAPLENNVTGVYSYQHIFDDIAGVIRNFTPLAPKRFWNEDVRNFTRAAVAELERPSETDARQHMSAVASLVIWTVNIACLPLTREVVFSGSNIDAFINKGAPAMNAASLHNYRLRLLRVSSELVDFNPVRRDAWNKSRNDPFAPYEQNDLIGFRNQAATRSTALRRHNWMTLLALGAGCALSTTEIVHLPVSAITANANGVYVAVAGKRARTVVCLAAWEDEVLKLVKSPLAEHFLFAKDERPTYPNAYVTRFIATVANDAGGFQVERLRSTWILEHIAANTPVFALMRALGVKSLSTLERLEPYVTVPDEAVLTAAFRLAKS